MASGLSMKVLLQLESKQFKKGLSDIKNSINSFKRAFTGLAGALVGGLGFANIVKELKDTSVEMSTAMAMLKNVSKEVTDAGVTIDHYAENLAYVKRISKEYHQDQLNMIRGFAQFSAAAKTCNFNLDEQREIYEALTRAAAGYHMSADQSNNMMLAVTQMMSKGKVAAEELRRQLGNSLPGAFGIMAAALGVSNAELEQMMKAGNVLAADALPKFAKALNVITEGMAFDSLQGSLNDFRNAWYNFVDSSQFDKFYKSILEISTRGLEGVTKHFMEIKATISGALNGLIAFVGMKTSFSAITGAIAKGKDEFAKMKVQIDAANASISKLNKNKIIQKYSVGTTGGALIPAGTSIGSIDRKDLERIQEYNKALITSVELQAKGGNKLIKTAYNIKELKKQTKEIDKYLKSIGQGNDILIKGTSTWHQLWKGVAATIKSIAISMAAMAVISTIVSAVSALLNYSKQVREEWARINNITKEYEDEQYKIDKGLTEEHIKLKKCKEIINDSSKSFQEHKLAVDKINEALGLTGEEAYDAKKIFDDTGKLIDTDIISAVDKWIERMKLLAKVTSNINTMIDKSARNEELNLQLDELAKKYMNKTGYALWGNIERSTGNKTDYAKRNGIKDEGWINRNVKPIIEEIKKNQQVIDAANAAINKAEEELAKNYGVLFDDNGGGNGGGGNGGTGNGKTPAEKVKEIIDEYKKGKKALKENSLNQDEYIEGLDELESKTWKALAAFDGLDKILKKLGGDYADVANELKGLMTDKAFNTAIDDMVNEYAKAADKELQDFLDNAAKKDEDYANRVAEIFAKPFPKEKQRDTFFDYKKDRSDILGDMADNKDEYVNDLEEIHEALLKIKEDFGKLGPGAQLLLDYVVKKLREAGAAAKDLRTKANVSEWIEDVKKLMQELEDARYDNFKNVAESFDRLVRGSRNLADAWATLTGMEVEEGTQEFFDRLEAGLSIINEFIQMSETMRTVSQGLLKVQEAQAAVQKALSDEEKIAAAVKFGILSKEQGEALKGAFATVTGEKVKQKEIKKTIGLLGAEAVAGAASSQSAIPVIGPILAAAAVAGIIAIIAKGMQKFAGGGIVGGTSTFGDHNIIRANSGEAVLTKMQQKRLFDIANGKAGVGGEVEFSIRGDKLIGTLKNYQKLRGGR